MDTVGPWSIGPTQKLITRSSPTTATSTRSRWSGDSAHRAHAVAGNSLDKARETFDAETVDGFLRKLAI